MLKNYNDRHTFLSEATSPHTLNLILNLVYKNVLKKDDLLLIIYGSVLSDKSMEDACKAHGISVLRWEDVKKTEIYFLTLNPLSLGTLNAGIITFCIDNKFIDPIDVNILMQDDELDRWNRLYNKTGSLQIDSSASIDENVLNILQIVNNYIIPYSFSGEVLEKILGRKLNIIDAILPFSILDYKSQKTLEKFIGFRKKSMNKDYYRILIYTKPREIRSVFRALVLYIFKNKNNELNKKIIIGIWFGSGIKNATFFKILSLIIKYNNVPIILEAHSNLTNGQYLLMLNQYDCLMLQGRGGFSTAKYFAEKVGKVITLTDSYNDIAFKKYYGINTFNSESLLSALEYSIKTSHINEAEKINKHTDALVKRHNSSFKVLQSFWHRL